MDEALELPVHYKGQDLSFPARLVHTGYTYRIEVTLPEALLRFERDEEGGWRALLSEEDLKAAQKIDRALIEAMLETLEQL